MQFKCSNKSLLFNNKLFVIKSLEHLIQFILSYEGGEDDWGQGGDFWFGIRDWYGCSTGTLKK